MCVACTNVIFAVGMVIEALLYLAVLTFMSLFTTFAFDDDPNILMTTYANEPADGNSNSCL